MGKKSRRKKENKKERAERLQERREERLHTAAESSSDETEGGSPYADDEIQVGDRVWTSSPFPCRAIVRSISQPGKYQVVPLLEPKHKDPGGLETKEWRDSCPVNENDFIAKDLFPWALRFSVGDRVVCSCYSGWRAGVVSELFPIEQYLSDGFSAIPCYKCRIDDTGEYICAPEDNDECIRKRPASFRFSEGDQVLISTQNCLFAGGLRRASMNDPWIQGRVTEVEIFGMHDGYAVYQCSVSDNDRRPDICYVARDTDDCIASLHSTPRERLMAAIEQDCNYAHLDFLIQSSGLDVMSFHELVLNRAIAFGNYDMLLWLQENTTLDLQRLEDENGNKLLHQIADSPHAERYFERDIERLLNRNIVPKKEIDYIGNSFSDSSMLKALNGEGLSWLDILVSSGNLRALEMVLSPEAGLRRRYMTRSDQLQVVYKRIAHEDKYVAQKLLDECYLFQHLFDIVISLDFIHGDNLELEEEKILNQVDMYKELLFDRFSLGSMELAAKKVIAFHRRWHASTVATRLVRSINEVVFDLAERGLSKCLRWLINADESLLRTPALSWPTSLNRDEFVQPELLKESEENLYTGSYEEIHSLVSAATLGKSVDCRVPFKKDDAEKYSLLLDSYWRHQSAATSLVTFLKERSLCYDYRVKQLMAYKIKLLTDDDALPGRIKVLNYLVREKGEAHPCPLEAVRWRQCGVLRWLIQNSFLELSGPVTTDAVLSEKANQIKLFGRHPNLASMTTGAFLCLAAIEYDDLQTLQWLTKIQKTDLDTVRYKNWNIVHVAARYGRSEILIWFSTSQPAWKQMVEEPCGRGPNDPGSLYAVHLAIEKGFVKAADVLLFTGCPPCDKDGRTLDFYALRSDLGFVQEWGEKKAKPIRLKKDLVRLECLLSSDHPDSESLKKHLRSTKCLDYNVWEDCEVDSFSDIGPHGRSYLHMVILCCEAAVPEFIEWLCDFLTYLEKNSATPDYSWRNFWGLYLPEESEDFVSVSTLMELSKEEDDRLTSTWLDMNWEHNFKILDPAVSNPMLRHLLNHFKDESSVYSALSAFRRKSLRMALWWEIREHSPRKAVRMIQRGCAPPEVDPILEIFLGATSKYAAERQERPTSFLREYDILLPTLELNLDYPIDFSEIQNTLKPQNTFQLYGDAPYQYERLYIFLAIQGYDDLLRWTKDRRSNWDATKELAGVRLAAYYGHSGTVDVFLEESPDETWFSSTSDRLQAAILGAAEAGRLQDVLSYLSLAKQDAEHTLTPVTVEWEEFVSEESVEWQEKRLTSLPDAATFGFLSDPSVVPGSQNSEGCQRLVKWLVQSSICTVDSLLIAAGRNLQSLYKAVHYERFIDLFKFLMQEGLDIWPHQQFIILISMLFIKGITVLRNEDREMREIAVEWLELLVELGVDIESMPSNEFRFEEKSSELLADFQAKQRRARSSLCMVKKSGSLDDIKKAVASGHLLLTTRDRGGLLLVHLAAAYDRVDVLEWLVMAEGASLDATDAFGRNVLEIAKASNAESATKWITDRNSRTVVSVFLSTHVRRILALRSKRRLIRSIVTIQAWQRGVMVRKTYRDILDSRLGESQRFDALWTPAFLSLSGHLEDKSTATSWASTKELLLDIMRAGGMAGDGDNNTPISTAEKLKDAVLVAMKSFDMQGDVDDSEKNQDSFHEDVFPPVRGGAQKTIPDHDFDSVIPCAHIRYTPDIVKWLRTTDPKLCDFFVQQADKLAAGLRSRTLAKRLVGYKTLIYEAYLEQKLGGHRILWTPEPDGTPLLWYVAKHDAVTHRARLIDNAESRSNRQRIARSSLLGVQDRNDLSVGLEPSHRIHLDPLGNAPLKIYQVESENIYQLTKATWKPQLYLTEEERGVVEAKGTVLLLGRSGTGKTLCICNRMDFDRHLATTDASFMQLFVARSYRLCSYVKETVGDAKMSTFTIFRDLVKSLETSLPAVGGEEKRIFIDSQRVDFQRFKREVFLSKESGGLDALVVWTNIRSFIKGSIEALQSPGRVLSREDYVAVERLGRRRCRLEPEQRERVYDVFEAYRKYMNDKHLWDDCDRVLALLESLQASKLGDASKQDRWRYSKVYVDEVQDYVQAEILLFFYLSGPGDLFFAGDPAQSVVEGVDFRFEEIRSVGYYVAGPSRHDLIPSKPKTVNVNFRSHSGVLNVAAGILRHLFGVFPDSAKVLREDKGLYQGPRPGAFHKVSSGHLKEAVHGDLMGTVLLTHDEHASHWKRVLDYQLVYGIREAKGLEFHSVVVLDFFGDLPISLQRPWRDLLLGRDTSTFREQYPEVEGQLKLLYTAITRCIEQLCIAETKASVAGDAFIRWLTTSSVQERGGVKRSEALAEKLDISKASHFGLTPDQVRVTGLDNAIRAETTDDLEESESFLEKSLYCFQLVNDVDLARKARAHRSSVLLRLDLLGKKKIDAVDDVEIRAANVLQHLFSEGLLVEARMLCEAVIPRLSPYSQEQIHSRILSVLPQLNE